jgi:hypothetical protein
MDCNTVTTPTSGTHPERAVERQSTTLSAYEADGVGLVYGEGIYADTTEEVVEGSLTAKKLVRDQNGRF